MPLTRADKLQIDEYISTGQIHNARRMLQDNQDDPQAAKALEKFNQKYPPTATRPIPMPAAIPVKAVPFKSPPAFASPTLTDLAPDLPRDEMADVRLAIKERRYDDARALLVLSDHPDADKMLERLSHLGGSEKVKRGAADEDVDLTAKFQITFFLLIFLTVFGLVALGIFVPEAKKHPNAPGAGGLLLMNKIVRFILYSILAFIVFVLILSLISYILR
jgi:hypothetical protein